MVICIVFQIKIVCDACDFISVSKWVNPILSKIHLLFEKSLDGWNLKSVLFGIDQIRSIRILWVSLIFFKMGLLLILRYKDQSIIFLIEENV